MDEIATMSADERGQLFRIVADEAPETLGITVSPGVIEKDFWVCWLMGKLFALPLAKPSDGAPRMLFKGGTSLSKVFGAIKRFSEDIDVSIEPGQLSVDLAALSSPELSNTKRKELGAKLTEACAEYVRMEVQPALLQSVSAVLGDEPWLPDLSAEEEQSILLFLYPRTLDPDSSLVPEVRLEFGARADLHPWAEQPVRPYVWDVRPDVFNGRLDRATASVPTLNAERTFWEKVTILHVENIRAGKNLAGEPRAWRRISRHGYDLAMLHDVGVADNAIPDEGLLRRVCETKHLWFRTGFSDYRELKRENVSIVPRHGLRDAFIRDYAAMRPMFFVAPPPIEELLAKLEALEARIRGVG